MKIRSVVSRINMGQVPRERPCINRDQKSNIAIHTNGQAVVKALRSYAIDSELFWECRNKYSEICMKNNVFLIWVLDHSGIVGNKEANTLARKGA